MPEPAKPRNPDELALRQTADADILLNREVAHFARWPWQGVHDLVGPLLPGDLWVIGARPGNGKTTFCLNALDNFVEHSMASTRWPVLYLGTEMEPALLRVQWASWRLGLPVHSVLEGDWAAMPEDAREMLRWELQAQAQPLRRKLTMFAPARRLTPEQVEKWVEYAVRHDCRAIILDHIHTVVTKGGDTRTLIGETISALKEQAVKHSIVVLVAAQVNRPDRTPLADLVPPPVSALKESGKLEEVCDVALLLHRPRRANVDAKVVSEAMKGTRPVTDLLEPDTMCVRVGKHRRRGHLLEQAAFLHVSREGRLSDRAPTWLQPPAEGIEDRYDI